MKHKLFYILAGISILSVLIASAGVLWHRQKRLPSASK
jgi:nitrogen fixation-related uncharacterized protein